MSCTKADRFILSLWADRSWMEGGWALVFLQGKEHERWWGILEQILGSTAWLSVQDSHFCLLTKMKGSHNWNLMVGTDPKLFRTLTAIHFETGADHVPGARSDLIVYQLSLRKNLSEILHLFTLSRIFTRGFMTRKDMMLCRKSIFAAAEYISASNERCCSI